MAFMCTTRFFILNNRIDLVLVSRSHTGINWTAVRWIKCIAVSISRHSLFLSDCFFLSFCFLSLSFFFFFVFFRFFRFFPYHIVLKSKSQYPTDNFCNLQKSHWKSGWIKRSSKYHPPVRFAFALQHIFFSLLSCWCRLTWEIASEIENNQI